MPSLGRRTAALRPVSLVPAAALARSGSGGVARPAPLPPRGPARRRSAGRRGATGPAAAPAVGRPPRTAPVRPPSRRQWGRAAVQVAVAVLVTAAVVAVIVAALAGPRRSAAGPAVPACPGQPALGLQRLPGGATPRRTAAEVTAAAHRLGVGAAHLDTVVPALVRDPVADRLGLGTVGTARLMWVLSGSQEVTQHGQLGATTAPVRTTLHLLTLLDDATLRTGGTFAC